MQGQERVAAIFQTHRFDQLEARIAGGKKTRLQETLGVFGRRLGIDDDAAADAQPPAPVRLKLERPDGDVEAAVAARRQPADGAGV